VHSQPAVACLAFAAGANETLDFINVNPNATLAITGGTFSVVSTANTFSNVYNFGTITVGAVSTLQLGAKVSGDSTEINGPGTVLVSGTGTTELDPIRGTTGCWI
jgi:hypothetical protein